MDMPVKDFVAAHDKLTDLYYRQGQLSKEEFESAHAYIWLSLDEYLIKEGLREDHYTDPVYDKETGELVNQGTIRRSAEIAGMVAKLPVTEIKATLTANALTLPVSKKIAGSL